MDHNAPASGADGASLYIYTSIAVGYTAADAGE